jgi:hypothetical protein
MDQADSDGFGRAFDACTLLVQELEKSGVTSRGTSLALLATYSAQAVIIRSPQASDDDIIDTGRRLHEHLLTTAMQWLAEHLPPSRN